MSTVTHKRAFTLIELLVVIGIIAVLAAGIGVAFLGGSHGNALQNSQGVVNSLASVARSKAALTQSDAAILVNTKPGTDGFLREFRVAVRNATATRWLATGDSTFLDKGIYLVPAAATFATDVTTSGSWTGLNTTAFDASDISPKLYTPDDSSTITTDDYRVVAIYNPRGTLSSASPGTVTIPVIRRIVLASALSGSDGKLTFATPDEVRGVLLSTYGVPTLINESEAFK